MGFQDWDSKGKPEVDKLLVDKYAERLFAKVKCKVEDLRLYTNVEFVALLHQVAEDCLPCAK